MAKKPIYNPSLQLQKTPAGKKYLDRIRKMTPFERLIYWIEERHRIHCKRFRLNTAFAGKPFLKDISPHGEMWTTKVDMNYAVKETPPPWTEDPVLQTIFFCNPYRENDKVTAYLRDNFREKYRDDPCVFLGTILLRMFNFIPTMRLLINANIPQRLGSEKHGTMALKEMESKLRARRDREEEQIFGGAYIIIFPPGMQKVEAAYKTMMGLLQDNNLYSNISGVGVKRTKASIQTYEDVPCYSLEYAFRRLSEKWGIGQFYTYQYVGDLAHTHVLEKAPDLKTWGYCGPGTARGLYRLQGITEIKGVPLERRCPPPKDAEQQLADLQVRVNKRLIKDKFPLVHMRDLCNCLCEYDKYNRALNNERHVKRPYSGT